MLRKAMQSEHQQGDVLIWQALMQTVQFAVGLFPKRRWLWLAAPLREGDLWALTFFLFLTCSTHLIVWKNAEGKKVSCHSQDLLECSSQDSLEKVGNYDDHLWDSVFFRFQIRLCWTYTTENVSCICRDWILQCCQAKNEITKVLCGILKKNSSLCSVREL